jgi:hypothetical protein
MKMSIRNLRNLILLSLLTVYGCSVATDEKELIFSEVLEVENLNDQEALGETFVATIRLPLDVELDTILFENDLPDLEITKQKESIIFKTLVDTTGVIKLTGKIIATANNGEKIGYRFFTAYRGFIPSVYASGTYLIRNRPNEILIASYYGERLDSTVVKMENATFERNGNIFFVTPGNESKVTIWVMAYRNNPPSWVMLDRLKYEVIDK